MQNLRILNSKEVKRIRQSLEEQYGLKGALDYVFLLNNKKKIYVVSKSLSSIDLDSVRKDSIGLYFAQLLEDGIRLTIEGSQIIGPSATKNVLLLPEEYLDDYLKGLDLPKLDLPQGYYIVKHDNDFMGCVKVTAEKTLAYVSKARRLKAINS